MALALLLWLTPLSASAASAASASDTTPTADQAPPLSRNRRMALILGGTVLGVGGLWLNLYKRGK